MVTVEVLYHHPDLIHPEKIEKGDWIDLRAAEEVSLRAGEFRMISLGISVRIPQGYELLIAPRSSTFKNFGILQTNSVGVVDESYCTAEDILMMPVLAMRDTVIRFNDRICQCRLLSHQPEIEWRETDRLDGEKRGGFGSSGIK